jgi:hypothetical protein
VKVEIIRDVDALTVRWPSEAGDLWTVTKRFNLGTRILEKAKVYCTGARWSELEPGEALQAMRLAKQMDKIFIVPAHFDLVQIEHGRHTNDGSPAWIRPRDGSILITRAPQDEPEKEITE